MSKPMTLERFEELVAAYGAQSALWPSQERDAMAQVLAESADADAILARAARLDAVLDTRLPIANAELQEIILRDMHTALDAGNNDIIAFPQSPSRATRMVWSMATALAACFIGGVIIGPVLVEAYIGDGDLMVSFDIISDAFLPTEPL